MSERDFNEIFAERLRYYLEKYNMTQLELSKRLGVGTTSVYNWTNAVKTPRMDKVDAMCKIFHCKRSDLINDQANHGAAVPNYSHSATPEEFEKVILRYRQLDDLDQGKIIERMDTMLEAEKYNVKKELLDGKKIS